MADPEPPLERFVAQVGRLRSWAATHTHHPAFRLLRVLFAAALLAVCLWFIWRQIAAGYRTITVADLHLDPLPLALSWLSAAAATALGAWEWVLLVNALGAELGFAPGTSIHLSANLTKYVPGTIWPFAGKAYLATRWGVAAGTAALSIAAELGILYLDGVLLMLLCLPFSGIVSWPMGARVACQAGAVLLTGVSLFAGPRMARGVARRLARARSRPDPLARANWSQVTLVMGAVLLTWGLLGFGFTTLYTQSLSLDWPTYARHSFALAAALLLGQVAFFAPLGLGVREAALVGLLSSDQSATIITVLAVVFRLQVLIGELICAAVAWALVRLARRKRFGPTSAG